MSISGNVLGFVMAGGNGSRLKLLTKDRCKPALNILGRHKIFDFVASNIANTGIPVTLVATQFKPDSLCTHIKSSWELNWANVRFEIIKTNKGNEIPIFEGTADSVRKSMHLIDRHNPDIAIIFGADHVYFLDYKDVIKQHHNNNADMTIMTNPVPDRNISDFGIVKIDDHGRIIDFAEKPKEIELVDSFRLSSGMKGRLCIEDPNMNFLASMGNYIFYWDRLKSFLDFPGADFGKDIIPAIKADGGNLYAHVFNGYWRDVGKIQDFFNCNMAFARKPISLLDSWIKTPEPHFPPPHIDSSSFTNRTILSAADVIGYKNSIVDSVLGQSVVTEEGCKLNHCILLGDEIAGSIQSESITRIGKGSHLDHVILDKNVWIGAGVNISPQNGTVESRKEILQGIGLKPYREFGNGIVDGDFYIEPETGILVIGEQRNSEKPILPDGLRC